MGATDSSPLSQRRSSTQHYHTFATPPPKSRGRPPSSAHSGSSQDGSTLHNGDSDTPAAEAPLPKKQMAVLAIIALAEQTAFNSISPYLPDMTSSFPEVHGENVGVYVGIIASAFALAQFVTNYFWGWLSDRVGRKPVILCGTICTAICFALFGFCRTLWQAILVQVLMGTLNGNQGLVSTCLGEITNRSNQSRAFTYLPVLYGLGGITGPVLGGSLVFKSNPFNNSQPNPYPYLLPNLISAAILIVDFIISIIFLEESLAEAESLPRLKQRMRNLFTWFWQFTSSHRPTYLRAAHTGPFRYHEVPCRPRSSSDVTGDSELDSASETPDVEDNELNRTAVFNRDTVLLLTTYLIFALVNVAYNSLYPIFAQASEPTGRSLTPQEIGLSLGFSGVVTIVFQVFIFGKLRDKMGNKWSYRTGLLGFVIAFFLMPFVGYKGDDQNRLSGQTTLLAIELCIVLLIKTVSAVGGLTSALLLVSLGILHSLDADILTAAGDELRTKPSRPRRTKWSRTDPVCCWPCHWPLSVWWSFLTGIQTGEGRITCLR
jgi:MFS family permease